MCERLILGARVRVVLNGRRVGGWVVDLANHGERDHHVALDRLSPLVQISGHGVDPEVVSLTKWVAQHWWGPWRAVLSSASAPRVRERAAHPRHGDDVRFVSDPVAKATQDAWSHGGGLLVVPPLASSLSCVVTAAAKGPVLAICPTVRMAVAGAAALRRRGLTTALIPDDWENARAGVDVVIGTRSSVFAPVQGLASIVVIDEHDEAFHEERAPTWDAVTVASERARRAKVPFFSTSPVPSVHSLYRQPEKTMWVRAEHEWPTIRIADLNEVPVHGSLLTSEMLQKVSDSSLSTVCVLNTKGKARLVLCKSCRAVQRCNECLSLLSQDDAGMLTCARCVRDAGSVCQKCGRSAFVVPRAGVGQLRQQIEANSSNEVVEITSDSDDKWTSGRVFIGTEAVLYRVPTADVVVFADIDRDLSAPRMTSGSEVLALIARAARIVGTRGQVIIQTRQIDHPVITALSSASIAEGIRTYLTSELSTRVSLGLPPATRVVRVALPHGYVIADEVISDDVMTAREEEALLLRSDSDEALNKSIRNLREIFGTTMRVYADPRRF